MGKTAEIIIGGVTGAAAAGIGFASIHEALYSPRDPSAPKSERYKTPPTVGTVAAGGALVGVIAEKYSAGSATRLAVGMLAAGAAIKFARVNGLVEAR